MIQPFSFLVLVMIGLGAVESTAANVDYKEKCKKVEDLIRICSECEKAEHPDSVICLTTQEMRDSVEHLEPLKPPGLGSTGLRGGGILSLEVWFDPEGNVSRARAICGHPLLLSVAMRALRKWTFKPIERKGEKRGGCGIVTIKFDFRNGGASTELQ